MAKSDPNLLTQAEYARHRAARGLSGGTKEAVRKAVNEQRISAFGPDKLISADLADMQWEKNTRSRVSTRSAAGSADAGQLDLPKAARPAPSPSPAPAPVDNGYSEARTRRERAEADEAELRLQKLRGEVVMREDVDRAVFEVMRALRDQLTSAGRRIASEVASLTSAEACEQVIEREHRIALELVVKGCREKIGAGPGGKAA